MAEPTIFQQGTFQVTRRRILLDDQQYALRDISSVEIATARVPRTLVVPAMIFGIGAFLVSQFNGSVAWLAASVLLFVLVGVLWWRANRTYILVLGTSQGNKQVFTSNDRHLIDRAAQAIDALLVERGRL